VAGIEYPSDPAHTSDRAHIWPKSGIRPPVLVGLSVLLVFVFMLSLSTGSVNIPLDQIAGILLGGEPIRATWTDIVWLYRVPKAITAVLAGAALGVAGLQMQTLFRNPLADPFVLGISSGASLGVALVVLGSVGVLGGSTLLGGLGLVGDLGVVIAASLGAAAVMAAVMLAAQRVQTMTLLILGLMFGYAVSALVSILLHFSIAERIHAYISWTFGSFGGTTWAELKVFVPVLIIALGMAAALTKPLNALLLGEQYARSMGLTVRRARFWIIVSASIAAGAVTAFCGPIGFLGIAIPHLCRSLFGTSDHRILIPTVMLTGGIVALVADLVAQVPGNQIVLPLNAITALIGAPVVAWVILSRKNLKESFVA
jgi:iron complex transport system permease protein